MGGLRRHTQRLADVCPGPTSVEGAIDGFAFEGRGEPAQRDHGGERLGGVIGGGNANVVDHVINFS